jgi:hypothetical protein
MISKSMDSKIYRKIKRAQSIIAGDIENIKFHNEPAKVRYLQILSYSSS